MMSRVTRAPNYDEIVQALDSVQNLKKFCKDFYKLFDTTDLDFLESEIEADLEMCGV